MQQQQQQQLTTRFFIIFVGAIVAIILTIATDAVHAKSFDEATLLKIRTNCKQQTKPQLNDAEYKLIADNKLLTAATTSATTSKSLQCYCLCYLNATGIYNNKNTPNNIASLEYLRSSLPTLVRATTPTNEMMIKCGKPTGADDCEKAFNFVNCMAKEAKIYFY